MGGSDRRIYLDHNATSPLRPEAREALAEVLESAPANPSSLHAEGRAARAVLDTAREQVARLAGISTGEIVFTSGGSEAASAAVRGVVDRAPPDRRRIVVSAVEHSAVLDVCERLSRRGFVVVRVACDEQGRVDTEKFIRHLGPGVALAALQWANNETGVIQPVGEIGAACRHAGVPFFVDAVQAAGKIALDPHAACVDLMALSAHKLGGPQGVGALTVRSGISLAPLISGGTQEKRRRGGTEGVATIAGFGAAAEVAEREQQEETQRLLRLRAKLETRLRDQCRGIRFHGQAANRLPNTVNFAVSGLPGETLAIAFDLEGFAVSTGSACASGGVEPSHVIRAMGFDDAEARGAVRLSLGWSTTAEDVDRLLACFPDVVAQVRRGLDRSV
ncbi:MAG: cysteine desulfurase [bacterium]|nr:cysteine desulfurase [bacterium]